MIAIARFWHSFARIEKAILLCCCAALLFFAGSAWSRSRSLQQLPPVFQEAPRVQNAGEIPNDGAPILVHIAGAVGKPGVLQLPPDARVADAVKAAGGVKPDGDSDALNLAQKLEDGQQILVPKRGAPNLVRASTADAANGQGSTRAAKGLPVRPVNVNSASSAELQTLPGIGPALAERIIVQRAKGRFSSLNDLDAVSGLGPKKLEQIKPYVAF